MRAALYDIFGLYVPMDYIPLVHFVERCKDLPHDTACIALRDSVSQPQDLPHVQPLKALGDDSYE
eukprot:scaffold152046_cov45-Prasinocladus_malaysianus.AAC.1